MLFPELRLYTCTYFKMKNSATYIHEAYTLDLKHFGVTFWFYKLVLFYRNLFTIRVRGIKA